MNLLIYALLLISIFAIIIASFVLVHQMSEFLIKKREEEIILHFMDFLNNSGYHIERDILEEYKEYLEHEEVY